MKKLNVTFCVLATGAMLVTALLCFYFLRIKSASGEAGLWHNPQPDRAAGGSAASVNFDEMKKTLALKPVITGDEPRKFTYAISYNLDAYSIDGSCPPIKAYRMCNVLSLVVNGQDANSFKLVRQKDNTYLVEWFATCSPFGTNHLQMKLYVMLGRYSTTNIIGEPRAEFNGNQLQWDSETTGFFRNLTEFNAHLQVSSADYRIAILDENSNQIDQIHGHTDNHEISERWISGVSEKFKGSNQELSAIIYVTPATAASNGVANTNPATECFSYP